MKKAVFVGVLGVMVMALPCFAAGEAGKDLPSLKATYEKTVNTIMTNYDATVKGWPENYVAALKALQTKLQKDGNLDGWSDVKAELERFQADPKIGEDNLSARPELQVVQVKFKELPQQASLEKNQKIVSWSQKYLARLNTMQSDLTKQQKMDEALAVNAEIKRVKASSGVTSAEFEISELEATKPQAKKDAAPPKPDAPEAKPGAGPGGKPPVAKGPVEVEVGDDEVKVYEGKAPNIPGMSFKVLQARNTPNVGAKRKLNVNVMLGTVSDSSTSSSSSDYATSKSKSGSSNYRVRLQLKTPGTGVTMEGATIALEYYCKDVNGTAGKVAPEKVLCKHITIPKIDIQGVFVDGPQFSTSKSSYSRYSTWGSNYKEKSGKDFYGVIVSVFDADKALVYQSASGSALEEFATTELPEEKQWNEGETDADIRYSVGPGGSTTIKRGGRD